MAWSKIVGLEVSPVIENSSIYRRRVPLASMPRVILSSHRLWPRSWSCCVALMEHPSVRWDESYQAGGAGGNGRARITRSGRVPRRLVNGPFGWPSLIDSRGGIGREWEGCLRGSRVWTLGLSLRAAVNFSK